MSKWINLVGKGPEAEKVIAEAKRLVEDSNERIRSLAAETLGEELEFGQARNGKIFCILSPSEERLSPEIMKEKGFKEQGNLYSIDGMIL